MKKLLCFVILMLLAVNCFAANINFMIPDAKLPRIVSAMKGLYTIPSTADAEGVVTNDFTDNQWAKECVRRFIIQTVGRYEQIQAQKAIEFTLDNSLVE